MQLFDINDFDTKYVMHCGTQEQAEMFCEYLHGLGRRWHGKEAYSMTTHWEDYKENTFYNFNSNTYAYIDYYIEEGYCVLEFDGFFWPGYSTQELNSITEDEAAVYNDLSFSSAINCFCVSNICRNSSL